MNTQSLRTAENGLNKKPTTTSRSGSLEGLVIDISEKKQKQRNEYQASIHLTGIYNRIYFDMQVKNTTDQIHPVAHRR